MIGRIESPKEFEGIMCIASDEGWEFELLNSYCIRLMTKRKKYLYDIWVATHKKTGKFIGFTIHNWETKTYDRKIHNFEEYIKK